MTQVTAEDMRVLRSMAGCTHKNKKYWGYRNWYAGTADNLGPLLRLEASGLAVRGEYSSTQPVIYFHVTEKGCEALKLSRDITARVMDVGL